MIEMAMLGKYRDKAVLESGGGAFVLFFLIDDYVQIEFSFSMSGKYRDFTVSRRHYWLRGSDGTLINMNPKTE